MPMLRVDAGSWEIRVQPSGYSAYQRIQTETSSSGELISLLYDALARDIQRASAAFERQDGEATHGSLVHAQDVVLELVASLDLEHGELAQQLELVYQYMYRKLVDANVLKDINLAHEVAALLAPIREAWAQAVRADQAAPSGATSDRPRQVDFHG